MFNKGDKVKCINTGTVRRSSPANLTKNKVYEVASNQTEDTNLNVINDKGASQGYFPERFEAYEEPVVAPVLDLTKPLETQEGVPVTPALTDGRGAWKIRGYIGDGEELSAWTEDGKYYTGGRPSRYDLRNVAPKPLEREVYVNVYKNVRGVLNLGMAYDNLQDAASSGIEHGAIGRIKVKLVEGQYDE